MLPWKVEHVGCVFKNVNVFFWEAFMHEVVRNRL